MGLFRAVQILNSVDYFESSNFFLCHPKLGSISNDGRGRDICIVYYRGLLAAVHILPLTQMAINAIKAFM